MRWPTLGLGDLLRDTFFPGTVARAADTIPATAAGGVDGVAQTVDGAVPIGQAATGSVIRVRWDGSWPATRPTSRTDVMVICEAPSSISPSATWSAQGPAWMITGDRLRIRDYDIPPGSYSLGAYGEGTYGG